MSGYRGSIQTRQLCRSLLKYHNYDANKFRAATETGNFPVAYRVFSAAEASINTYFFTLLMRISSSTATTLR
jgi:hypothetical protein